MRMQLLAANVIDIDAVLWTHDHADHTHGIDDLRQVFHHRGRPVDAYARAPVIRLMRERFGYVFEGRQGYRTTVDIHELHDHLQIGDIAVRCTDMPHGPIFSTGFRFDHEGASIGYATDFHEVTPEMVALFSGLDVWVVDALRERPHPTHPHLELTLDAIEQTQPGRAYLIHMDQSMDYDRLCQILPPHVRPAYDGLSELAAKAE